MDPIAKLKEELEAKKRKLQEVASTTATTENTEKKKKVYLTKGQTKKLLEQSSSSQAQENSESSNKESESISSQQVDNGSGQTAKKWIPKEEVVRRLRSLKAPITLFGENDEERITRLRKLELSRPDEEEETRGQKNFLLEEKKREKEKLLEGDSSAEDELTPEQKREKKLLRLQKLKSKEDDALKTQNKHDLISTWLRRCLKEWEIDIDELSDDFAKTVKGRQEINTFKQTKIYLKPLFKMLKTRSLPGDILVRSHLIFRRMIGHVLILTQDRLGEIIKWCRRREYTKAADEYLLLSIGKAVRPESGSVCPADVHVGLADGSDDGWYPREICAREDLLAGLFPTWHARVCRRGARR